MQSQIALLRTSLAALPVNRGTAFALSCLALAWLGTAHAESTVIDTVSFASVAEIPVHSAPATVIARNQPSLAAEIEGRIIALPVNAGDRVDEGDLLARLDCRHPESALASARAELSRTRALQRFARGQLNRARDLKRKNSISDETLDQRRTDLAAAEADTLIRAERLRQAQIDVGQCELRAPFDAVVTVRHASVGSYATRGMQIVALTETHGQEVAVSLRHGQAAGLEAAEGVMFDSDGTRYPVRLRTLLPVIDPTTRTREARLTFDATPALPGTAGRIVWQGTQRHIPADYLLRRDGVLGVFLLDGETARFHPLPNAQDGRPAEAELPPDTLLIGNGRQGLRDGDRVHQADRSE